MVLSQIRTVWWDIQNDTYFLPLLRCPLSMGFAQANLFFFISFISRGFLIALLTLLPPSLSLRLTVWTDKWVIVSRLMSSAVSLWLLLLVLTMSRSCWTPEHPTRKVVRHPPSLSLSFDVMDGWARNSNNFTNFTNI